MTTAPTERTVTSVVDLLHAAELTGIRTYKVLGVRVEDDEERPVEPQQDLQVMVRGDANGTETRVVMVLKTAQADLTAEVGALYRYDEPLAFTPEIMAEFIEKVSMMAVFPFLRESIFTTATRLGIDAPVIGLLRAGDLQLSAPPTDDGAGAL